MRYTLWCNISIYCPFSTAINATVLYICNEIHNICIWNDVHNRTMCYVQHICKKLNFHNGMKSKVTLPNTPMLHSIFLNCKKHISTCIYKMKSITTKRCSLCYTYKRNCSSTKKNENYRLTKRIAQISKHRKTEKIVCPTWTRKANTKCSSLLVIGSSRNKGDRVICNFHDTCCHQQEIIALNPVAGTVDHE